MNGFLLLTRAKEIELIKVGRPDGCPDFHDKERTGQDKGGGEI